MLIPAALAEARQQLDPCGPGQAAKKIRLAVQQFRADDAGQAAAFLHATAQALGDYPIDLVKVACRDVVRTHRYPTLPTTADFVRPIEDELAKRQHLLRRLITAQKLAPRVVEIRPEDRVLPAEIEAKLAAIKAGGLRKVEAA